MNKTFNPLQFIWQLIQLQGELQYNCHHYLFINQSIAIWQLKTRKKRVVVFLRLLTPQAMHPSEPVSAVLFPRASFGYVQHDFLPAEYKFAG